MIVSLRSCALQQRTYKDSSSPSLTCPIILSLHHLSDRISKAPVLAPILPGTSHSSFDPSSSSQLDLC
jgi:hypothetical protein